MSGNGAATGMALNTTVRELMKNRQGRKPDNTASFVEVAGRISPNPAALHNAISTCPIPAEMALALGW